jgi:hypothetical protein
MQLFQEWMLASSVAILVSRSVRLGNFRLQWRRVIDSFMGSKHTCTRTILSLLRYVFSRWSDCSSDDTFTITLTMKYRIARKNSNILGYSQIVNVSAIERFPHHYGYQLVEPSTVSVWISPRFAKQGTIGMKSYQNKLGWLPYSKIYQFIPLYACFAISREFDQLFAKSRGGLGTVSTLAGLVYAKRNPIRYYCPSYQAIYTVASDIVTYIGTSRK